ncbi:MAG: response regulator [Magnetococcales bacterium]|nr:response regulator [Magnetococcales bacterium]
MEERYRRILQSSAAINALLRAGLTSKSFTDILLEALELVLFGSWLETGEKGAVYVVQPPSRELTLAVHHGLDETTHRQCAHIPLGHCLCGQVARDHRLVFALAADPRHDNRSPPCLANAHYGVPIVAKERLLGVLTVWLSAGHRQDPEEESFLLAMANTLAGIIERQQMEAERQAITLSLEKALAAARAADRAKSEFLATMSHEIRSPMNTILGMAELLAESPLNAEQQRFLNIANLAGQTLLALINDVLDLSKIEAGQLVMERVPFDLPEVVTGSLQILSWRAQDKGLDLRHRIHPGLPRRILGDPSRLRQVILNLVGNAIKFTNHGHVHLEVEPRESSLIGFSVADTGIGIPRENWESIFQPFVQADASTTRRFGGTGLGLTICRRLIERMGGRIWVESRIGEGSRFQFTIPLEAAEAPEGQEPKRVIRRRNRKKEAAAEVEAGMTLLLVDDSEDNLLLIQAFLKSSPHRVITATGGAEALARFQTRPFDLVFLDIQMPGMDGYEVARRIRAWEKETAAEPTPIVALTAHAMRDVSELLEKSGFDLHVTKPIRKRRLYEVIASFQEGKSPAFG